MIHEGRTLGGRRGKVPLGVLVFVAVVAVIVVLTMARMGRGGTSLNETSQDSGGPSLEELAPRSPLVEVADQLMQLIDSSEVVVMDIPELTAGMSAGDASRVRERWDAWSLQFEDRLEAIAAQLPKPPPEDAETALQRGYARLPNAIEALRRLLQPAAGGGVPSMITRTSQFGVARNHVASAQRYFFRIGL